MWTVVLAWRRALDGNRRTMLAPGLLVALLTVCGCGAGPVADVYVHVTGSDENNCTNDAPCATLDRAYRVAEPGETVEMGGGFYGRQVIRRDLAKAANSPVVSFRPALGATVTLRSLTFGSDVSSNDGPRNVALNDIRVADASGHERGIAAFAGTTNVTLENVDAANFYLNGTREFVIRGGDWGPCLTTGDAIVDGCSNSKIDANAVNDRITIDGASFHDYRIAPQSNAHFECLFIAGGTNITVRNSTFDYCEFYGILIQYFGVSMDGLRIENNEFSAPWNGAGSQSRVTALAFSPRGQGFRNVVVRGNTFRGSGIAANEDGDGITYSSFRIAQNRGTSYSCYPSAEYEANVWSSGPLCGPTDRHGG